MIVKFIEATNGPNANWGKFMVCRFMDEWCAPSHVDEGMPLLLTVGWMHQHLLIVDLQTGEGAIFLPGGWAPADLNKHKIWVCPLFEPFLMWLYTQDLSDLRKLPDVIDLPNAPFDFQGYRRPGPEKEKK